MHYNLSRGFILLRSRDKRSKIYDNGTQTDCNLRQGQYRQVIDYNPKANQADEYRELARKIKENTSFVIPNPPEQKRLEEILLEHGLMDGLEDQYNI